MEKIAVIGGGPAGLSAAIEGAKQGLSVTLYEKGTIGSKISCAEGFFDTLNILGKPRYGVKFRVEEIILRMKSSYTFPCEDKLHIWMMDKGEWQKGLAEEARALGVNILENSPVSPELLDQLKSQFTWVIDASGPYSVTARKYGFSKFYTDNSAIAAQYVLEGDFSQYLGKLKIGMEENLNGYYWIFPKSASLANVGICYYESRITGLWDELDRVLEKEDLASYKKLKKAGGLCPVKKLDRLVYDNILLTGDAAGLVSPLHAGGIDSACISGKLAIQSIIQQKVHTFEKMVDSVLLRKIKADQKLYDLWQTIGFKHLENATEIVVTNPEIKLDYGDLFNGNFNLFRNLKYLKYLKFLKLFIRNA